MHIILDLDETLVRVIIDQDEESIEKIIFRPYLYKFIRFLFKNFESVSIWSAGSKEYVKIVMSSLKRYLPNGKSFRFVYSLNECEFKHLISKQQCFCRHTEYKTILIKPLKKIFEKYEDMNQLNTVIIDDTDDTFSENYENAIWIQKFYGEKNDDCLLKVAEKLHEIKTKKKIGNLEIDWEKKSDFKF